MKTALQCLLLTGLLLHGAGSLHAQSMVPSAMNYQGVLTDNNGDPVANAAPENRNIEFRIYSQATGGTPLWGEAQTVTVFKGQFSVVLGNGTAVGGAPSGPASFAAVFANATSADLYFGITPQGGAEFAPRQKLLAGAYALRARVAEQVSATTGSSTFNGINANDLTMQGPARIDGGNVLEFGTNDAERTRNTAAGQIGYKVYSNGLDIVGAGPEINERRLTLWAEAGTEFKGPISFTGRYGQHISLNDAFNGFGVQTDGVYVRGFNRVSFFANGTHNDGVSNPGTGGTLMATLTPGGFTLNSGVFTGNGSGLTNISPAALPNNYNYLGINGNNVIEFGRGVAGKQIDAGKIGYGTFSGGAALEIVGAGTAANSSDRKINLHSQGGLRVLGPATVENNATIGGFLSANAGMNVSGALGMSNSSINFGSRTGQHINLWSNEYGIGIANSTTYFRTASNAAFRWYRGGSHADDPVSGTNGVQQMLLDSFGLTVNGGVSVSGTFTAGGFLRAPGITLGSGNWSISSGSDLDINLNGTRRAWLLASGGGWGTSSDRNLKKNIETFQDGLGKVMKLRPTRYHFKTQKDEEPLQPGFIAQEVEEIMPELVSQRDGVRGIDYQGLIPVTVAAVQEQQKKMESLAGENAELKQRLEALEKKLARLVDQLPESQPATDSAAEAR
ncbi:MAG: tail fiber domain-containing protein [Prosthecobacter sp.]|jgi:hypothetical protein|uniref:tail fiber domain-containing protein n=1 Tax=Prosthecobacter sp. TaxID=1965333 RepID=UPI0019DBCFB5|nr:tail fiber domain-containing protein [Prosthecobacter sp.]MBE2283807.1 tail fiber domain-containing protein [Prosthecobacter sp.]